jgi:hypothetical protein
MKIPINQSFCAATNSIKLQVWCKSRAVMQMSHLFCVYMCGLSVCVQPAGSPAGDALVWALPERPFWQWHWM